MKARGSGLRSRGYELKGMIMRSAALRAGLRQCGRDLFFAYPALALALPSQGSGSLRGRAGLFSSVPLEAGLGHGGLKIVLSGVCNREFERGSRDIGNCSKTNTSADSILSRCTVFLLVFVLEMRYSM